MASSNNKSKDGEQPMSMAWLCLKVAMLLLMLAFLLSCITFFSPFWMVELNTLYHTGLWGRCDDGEFNCIWFHERDYAWEKSLPGRPTDLRSMITDSLPITKAMKTSSKYL